jgi:hypothetical protein
LKFYTGDGAAVALTLIDGPEQCAAVSGRGWYLVPTDSGVIVEAPVVMTFEVCASACAEIADRQMSLLMFNINTCR